MTNINVTVRENWKFRLRYHDSSDINHRLRCARPKYKSSKENNWLEVSNAHYERIEKESRAEGEDLRVIFLKGVAVLGSKSLNLTTYPKCKE
jgi:hypothetical protein